MKKEDTVDSFTLVQGVPERNNTKRGRTTPEKTSYNTFCYYICSMDISFFEDITLSDIFIRVVSISGFLITIDLYTTQVQDSVSFLLFHVCYI